jgi:hypothetical protein
MNRKTILALALASAFGLSTFAAYADDEKKDEKPQLIVEDEKKDEKPQLIADDEKKDEKPQLIAEGGVYPEPDSAKGYFELSA